jgi:hypothetical protein
VPREARVKAEEEGDDQRHCCLQKGKVNQRRLGMEMRDKKNQGARSLMPW